MREAPLYTGLTRPPMVMGIPIYYWLVWMGILVGSYILLAKEPATFVSCITYAAFYGVTILEPNFTRIAWVVSRRTPPIGPSKGFYGV